MLKNLQNYCEDYNVPTWIMSRLIEYESGWNPYAVNENKNGSVDEGICQLGILIVLVILNVCIIWDYL